MATKRPRTPVPPAPAPAAIAPGGAAAHGVFRAYGSAASVTKAAF